MDAQDLTATTVGEKKSLENYATGFIAEIIATAVHAATTVTGKIEHSGDGTNWYDLATFAAIAGASGKEIVNVTAHVLPNVRANVTLAGATQEATVTVRLHSQR